MASPLQGVPMVRVARWCLAVRPQYSAAVPMVWVPLMARTTPAARCPRNASAASSAAVLMVSLLLLVSLAWLVLIHCLCYMQLSLKNPKYFDTFYSYIFVHCYFVYVICNFISKIQSILTLFLFAHILALLHCLCYMQPCLKNLVFSLYWHTFLYCYYVYVILSLCLKY